MGKKDTALAGFLIGGDKLQPFGGLLAWTLLLIGLVTWASRYVTETAASLASPHPPCPTLAPPGTLPPAFTVPLLEFGGRMVTRGFFGRNRPQPPRPLPPGQYLTRDFPVLSAGPTPRVDIATWTFSLVYDGETLGKWTWG